MEIPDTGLIHHQKKIARPTDFRYRSTEIMRIEGLSDAVFGFAVTLLIVSLEVPRTYAELVAAMHGFFAFAICFALLLNVWYTQHVFFRRYGLQDLYTIVLNAALLFTVLFYVYPLKFMFTLLVEQMMGIHPVVHRPDGQIEAVLRNEQVPNLMIIFSAGFVAVSVMFALMYLHAWRQRERLGLNELERHDTRESIGASLIDIVVGTVSILFAVAGGSLFTTLSGLIYPIGLTPGRTIYHSVMGRRRGKKEARYLGERVGSADSLGQNA